MDSRRSHRDIDRRDRTLGRDQDTGRPQRFYTVEWLNPAYGNRSVSNLDLYVRVHIAQTIALQCIKADASALPLMPEPAGS